MVFYAVKPTQFMVFFMPNTSDLFLGSKIALKMSQQTPQRKREIEEWIVNSLKIKIIRKLEYLLEGQGKKNLSQLFLAPVFSVEEMTQRVQTFAPEMKTFYFKELIGVYDEAEKRFV